MIERRTLLALLPVAGVSLISACSTGPADGAGSSSETGQGGESASGAFPVTIKHALGTSKITKRPTRVATLGWSDADMVLSLGVVPVGAPIVDRAGAGNDSTDYFDAALKKIGGKQPVRYSEADGAPVDEIAKLRPDVILAANAGLKKQEYVKLSKIAPVIAHPVAPYTTPWDTSMTMIGRALGRSAEARQQIARTRKVIKDARAKYPEFEGVTFAWTYFKPNDASQIGLTTPLDMRSQTMVSFGLKPSPFVLRETKDVKQFFTFVSAEKAPQVDAQVVVFQELVKGQGDTVKKDRLLGRIPALKRGAYQARYRDLGMYGFSAPSPLSIPYAVEHFLPRLAATVRQADSAS